MRNDYDQVIPEDQHSYLPDQSLVHYFHNLLHLLEVKKKADAGERQVQGKYSKDIIKEDQRLRTQKSRKILPEIVFPSMANLIFFFEVIDEHPELREVFESDVKELLGVRRLDPNLGNCGTILKRLVGSIISANKGFDPTDFRVKLMHELHKLIESKMQRMLDSIFWTGSSDKRVGADEGQISNLVGQDLGRALSWTGIMSSKVNDEYEKEYQILSKVESILKKKKNGNLEKIEELSEKEINIRKIEINQRKKKEFDKAVSKNRPKRTLLFNTKSLVNSTDKQVDKK